MACIGPAGEKQVRYAAIMVDGKVTVTLNDKVVMQDVPVEKGFDPPLLGPVEGPLRLQKSPHNVMSTFRNVFIRERQELRRLIPDDERGGQKEDLRLTLVEIAHEM